MDLVCDLDGTVWLAGTAIPRVPEAIARARAAGHRFLFATNNSTSPIRDIEAALASTGIPARGDVVSSAMATAMLVDPGERGFVIGGPGMREELESRGALVVSPEPGQRGRDLGVDFVAVGRDTSFDFAALALASDAIRAGARFLASNSDTTFPGPDGLEPGGGAIVAAVVAASGAEPVVAGKPNAPMAAAIKAALGGDASRAVVVGDVASTDGALAERLGVPFAMVLSGSTREPPADSSAAYTSADLAALIEDHFS